MQQTDSPTAKSSARRRAACDQRKRDGGEVRLSVWLPAEAVAALDRMVGGRLTSRDQALDATVHHLRQQAANGLKTVDVPAWVDGEAGRSPSHAVVGLRLPAEIADQIRRAGEAAGHESLAASVLAAVSYVSRLLATGTMRFTPRE